MITKFNFKDKTIKSYAIRKLTPFECFRLMGVRDDVIRTMQSTNAQAAERVPGYKGKGKAEDMAVSASQQYKQAGTNDYRDKAIFFRDSFLMQCIGTFHTKDNLLAFRYE